MMRIKQNILAVLTVCSSLFIMSCGKSDPNSPGIEFMPDMYYSDAAKPYEWLPNGVFKDSLEARPPVEGTISQGSHPNNIERTNLINATPYPFANTTDGYELAGANLKNPLMLDSIHLQNGEALYGKFCVHCHGASGDGQGSIVANGKFPSPNTYWSKVGLTDGKMFHTMHFGKGLMGSHAAQLSKVERWELVMYVNKLIKAAAPNAVAVSDTTKTKKG
jgi:mono/diheme cytochrome c family protein